MKVAIEGQVYELQPGDVRNRTLMDVERVTGMTTREWQEAITRESMIAVTALVWITLRANGQPDLAFDDVDFDPTALEIDLSDTEEEPGKDPTEDETPSPPS